MCSASYGIRSPSVTTMRSRRSSRLCSESTSWNTSARRRYDSASASGRPLPFPLTATSSSCVCAAAADRVTMRPSSAVAHATLIVPEGGLSLDQAAGAGGVRPGIEASARLVRAYRHPDLRPDRPVVRGAPAGDEIGAVEALEPPVHLEAAVVAVPRVRVPGALELVDAEEGRAERRRQRPVAVPEHLDGRR